ncbi:ABC transporter permease [Nocardioides sp. W7]|uniref:branched-chain amino acid ABC transporter permease n=1 Tax=Nocardioides sp. W7 TaxID=2931390 RepID=UPI001FD094F4|nr:ABC transporter permease [Nocardioides sp. W7]
MRSLASRGIPVALLAGVLALVVHQTWAGTPVTGESLLQLLVFSLPIAGIYAINAAGLVVVHSATGIFNLAHGAIGMFCAFVFWEINVNRGLPLWLSLVLVIGVVAPAIGLILDAGLMRRLKHAPVMMRLVGTVGLMVALMGLARLIWSPQNSYPTQPIGGIGGIEIAGVMLTWSRLITLSVAIALAIGLHLLLRGTWLGIAMRASVDNEHLAALNGISPARISSLAWVIGAVTAATAGILIAPEVGNMSVDTLSLLVINSFAAAVFGRLRSLGMAYCGALLLGLTMTFSTMFLNFEGRWVGVPSNLPLIALFVVLFVLPQAALPTGRVLRSFPVERLPSPRTVGVWSTVWLVLAGVMAMTASNVAVSRLSSGVALAVVLLGMVPLMGWAGIPFLAPLALAGVGAFVSLWAGGSVTDLFLGGMATGLIAMVLALPALRLDGLYMALCSVALAVVVGALVLQQPEVLGNQRRLDELTLAGIDLTEPRAFLVYAALWYLVIALSLTALRRRSYGRRLVALRDSEVAAACVGIRSTWTKATVFGLTGLIAGIGGGLYAQGARFAAVEQFPMILGLTLVLSMMVMGVGTVSAPMASALVAVLFTTMVHDWAPGSFSSSLELLAPGLAVLALIDMPRGQIPLVCDLFRRHPVRGGVTVLSGVVTAFAAAWLGLPGGIACAVVVLAAVAGGIVATVLAERRQGLLDPFGAGGPGADVADLRGGITVQIRPIDVIGMERELKVEVRGG